MPGPAFTNENVRAHLDEIAAQPSDTKAQSFLAVRTNLVQYVNAHFTLTPDQQNNLNSLPAPFLIEVGHIVAFALENGYPLEISLGHGPSGPGGATITRIRVYSEARVRGPDHQYEVVQGIEVSK